MDIKDIYDMAEAATITINRQKLTELQKNNAIIGMICEEIGITRKDMFTRSRKRERVTARYIYMKILYGTGRFTLETIGRKAKCFGANPFNHATVLYAVGQVNNLADTDRAFANKLKAIEHNIKLIGA